MCEVLAASPAGRDLAPFDAVILSGVLHHAIDPPALLRRVLRFLKVGGQLLVTSPNALSFHRLLAVEMGIAQTPHALDGEAGAPPENHLVRPDIPA